MWYALRVLECVGPHRHSCRACLHVSHVNAVCHHGWLHRDLGFLLCMCVHAGSLGHLCLACVLVLRVWALCLRQLAGICSIVPWCVLHANVPSSHLCVGAWWHVLLRCVVGFGLLVHARLAVLFPVWLACALSWWVLHVACALCGSTVVGVCHVVRRHALVTRVVHVRVHVGVRCW